MSASSWAQGFIAQGRRIGQHLRRAGIEPTLRRARFGVRGLRGHADYPGWLRRFEGRPATPNAWSPTGTRADNSLTVFVLGQGASERVIGTTVSSLAHQVAPSDIIVLGVSQPSVVTASSERAPIEGGPEGNAMPADAASFVVMVRAGDVVARHAVRLATQLIGSDPSIDIVYTDSDEIDDRRRRSRPWFKSGFDQELLLEQNYLSGFTVVRRSLLDAVGGAEEWPDGTDDHDLVLRLVELTEPDRVRHLPQVLLHRPARSETSGDGYTLEPAIRPDRDAEAVRGHLSRGGDLAQVDVVYDPIPRLRVRREMPQPPPAVTAVIPTRDGVDLLRACVEGLLHRTDYPDLRILVADNGSEEPGTVAYLKELAAAETVAVVSLPGPFNFSAINNTAVQSVTTPLLLLLNDDIEVIHREWLSNMVALVAHDDVGVVGAKLLHGDGTIQHAGVVLGIRSVPGVAGVAGHVHKGASRDEPGYYGRLFHTQETSAVTGACLLTHTDLWRALGGLDENNLAVAFNDVDYCLRVRAKGRRVVWTPLAELYHHESVSRGSDETGPQARRFAGEFRWMRERWGALLDRDPMYSPNLSLDRSDLTLAYPPRSNSFVQA